jgi:FAD/FMN-containing dehydrogenase
MPYGGIYEFSAEVENPMPAITRSLFTDRALDDATLERVVARMTDPERPAMTVTQIRVLGGEMGRVAADATAFAHRDAQVMFSLYTIFTDEATVDADVRFTDAYFGEIAPIASGAYVNFLDREGAGRIREAYPEATYRRLAEIKATWDPSNVLRRNQNIEPAAGR